MKCCKCGGEMEQFGFISLDRLYACRKCNPTIFERAEKSGILVREEVKKT